MTVKTFSATMKTDFRELEKNSLRVRDFLSAANVAEDVSYKVELAMEEMITNVIKYGYEPPSMGNEVKLKVEIGREAIRLVIEDGGHEFNPLTAGKPDLSLELGDRQVGGVGIHLTRNMTDGMEYCRVNGRNVLKIMVRI